MTDWTDDETKKLKGYVDDKFSIRQMGKELNKSKSSVISKIHRLGIQQEQPKVTKPEVIESLRIFDVADLPLDRRPTLPLIRCIADKKFLTFRMAPFGDYGHDL